MELWITWLALVNQFEVAFSRKKTFFWLIIVLLRVQHSTHHNLTFLTQ
jgi:hypothetical protein